MKRWSAAVIGLGNVGMGYDYKIKDGSFVLTHASGFYNSDRFRLVAGVDPDREKRKRFEKKYKVRAFPTIGEMYGSLSPDIIAIAVPTHLHYRVFSEVVKHGSRAIICEKPMSGKSVDAMRMINMAGKAGTLLVVNYMRITEPSVVRLKKMLLSGKLGKIYKGTVIYSKGLFNNCSHYINLLEHLIGSVRGVKVIRKGRRWLGRDPEPDFYIQFGNALIYFVAAKEENYSIGEIELIGSRGKVRYGASGNKVEYQISEMDPVFPRYRILEQEPKVIRNDLNRYQQYVLNELAGCLSGRSSVLRSSAQKALRTLKTMESIAKGEGRS